MDASAIAGVPLIDRPVVGLTTARAATHALQAASLTAEEPASTQSITPTSFMSVLCGLSEKISSEPSANDPPPTFLSPQFAQHCL